MVLGTMVPTVGLMQVGRQAMADRYAYQSFLGLFFIVCWGVADWATQKHVPKSVLPAISVAVLLLLSGLTYRQISYWSDNMTLWTHTLDATGNNWMAHDMVAGLLLASGHRDEAIVHYRAVLQTKPTDAGVNVFLALDEQKHGNNREAIHLYQNALKDMDDPLERAKAYQNMAIAYHSLGDAINAEECQRKAAKLRSIVQK